MTNIKSEEQASIAEEQIREEQRVVDYSIREYPLEVLVGKYLNDIDAGENEIFIPDYQRAFVWPDERQSRFIESVLMGLPIPYLFAADVSSEDEDLSGRLEVVDGTQRLRTLAAFISDELCLVDLKRLDKLIGMRFSDLLPSRQRRFKRATIRLIELTEKTDEYTRRDMFDRLNSGGMKLMPMEVRRGTKDSPLLLLVKTLAESEKLRILAPLSEASIKHRAYEELVLRFFAYLKDADSFRRSVIDFVNEFVDKTDAVWSEDIENEMKLEWENMINFVESNFENGFQKVLGKGRTPMVRFEAIAVGVALALREVPTLKTTKDEVSKWIGSEEFNMLVTSDGANSRPKLLARIDFVKSNLVDANG
ncbi:DUF262 domain-containing protein [Ahrensia sp. AH-315-G08]|nr:DUF262 domain-containing protein [Ahrensia sp. AH-315-G08]